MKQVILFLCVILVVMAGYQTYQTYQTSNESYVQAPGGNCYNYCPGTSGNVNNQCAPGLIPCDPCNFYYVLDYQCKNNKAFCASEQSEWGTGFNTQETSCSFRDYILKPQCNIP